MRQFCHLANGKTKMSLEHLTDEELQEYYALYKNGADKSNRFEIIKSHNFDIKFAYHIIRLFDEVEQIMLENDLDLQRAREAMKSVRRGDWTAEEVRNWAMEKEKALEVAYTNCKLPERPPEKPLHDLLLRCLEEHYGSLDSCLTQIDWAVDGLKEVDQLLEKFRTRMYNAT